MYGACRPRDGISADYIEPPKLEKVGRPADGRDPRGVFAQQGSSDQLDRKPSSARSG